MRKELLTSVCALSLLAGASTAFAGAYGEKPEATEMPSAPPAPAVQEVAETDYAQLGPYLGIGGVYAVELFDNTGDWTAANSSGFHVRGGYRVHPNVAVEALYENYTEFDLDRHDARGATIKPAGHLDGWSLTANAKGYLLTGRWQPYALFGMGLLNMGSSHNGGPVSAQMKAGNGFALRFGAGMDACITEHISMGPEIAYVLPFGDAQDADFLEINMGLRYKF